MELWDVVSIYVSVHPSDDVHPGPNAVSKAPSDIRQTMIPAKLKPVDIKVDDNPHPMTAQPSQYRGGKSFEVTVTGI